MRVSIILIRTSQPDRHLFRVRLSQAKTRITHTTTIIIINSNRTIITIICSSRHLRVIMVHTCMVQILTIIEVQVIWVVGEAEVWVESVML